jgi:hypothetical protein
MVGGGECTNFNNYAPAQVLKGKVAKWSLKLIKINHRSGELVR